MDQDTSTRLQLSWRRRLQLAAAFGAGFGAIAVVLGGLTFWWINRPTPWDGQVLQASFIELDSQPDQRGSPRTLRFRYAIRNTGRSDYRLNNPSSVSVMFKRGEALREAHKVTLTTPVLIPAGQSGEFELTALYEELVDLISSKNLLRARPEDIDSVVTKQKGPKNVYELSVALVPSELQGFMLYDNQLTR